MISVTDCSRDPPFESVLRAISLDVPSLSLKPQVVIDEDGFWALAAPGTYTNPGQGSRVGLSGLCVRPEGRSRRLTAPRPRPGPCAGVQDELADPDVVRRDLDTLVLAAELQRLLE